MASATVASERQPDSAARAQANYMYRMIAFYSINELAVPSDSTLAGLSIEVRPPSTFPPLHPPTRTPLLHSCAPSPSHLKTRLMLESAT